MERIKLMSDEEKHRYEDDYFKASLTASQHIDRIVDECERRATEKVKEAMLYGLNYKVPENKIFVSNDEIVQQFSKEQQNQEAITLLKEWKERDGSEIEENYNKLIKEQENGE